MVPVGDAGDPRLADYVRLTDVHLRRSLEEPSGLFVAEGEKVIRRAIGAGYPVRSLLITRDKLAGHADLAGSCPGPVYLVEPEVAEQVTGYRVHRGALASMQRLPLPSVAGVTGRARRIVVLEDIVDHTNVGAIFRCVAALGFDAVVLAPRCADPLYRRSVRVSMGAVFAVSYTCRHEGTRCSAREQDGRGQHFAGRPARADRDLGEALRARGHAHHGGRLDVGGSVAVPP